MRNAFILLALWLSACAHRTPAPPPIPALGGPLQLSRGQTLTITLDANPTTGFEWQLTSPPDAQVLTLVGHTYQGAAGMQVGGGGTDVWTFKAVGSGEATLVLEYRRPWEKDVPAAEHKRYAVVVR